MISVEVHPINAKEVRLAVRNLPRIVLGKAARRAFRDGAKIMKSAIQDQIREKGLIDTGNLLRNITIFSVGGRRGVAFKIATGTRAKMGIAADDPYYYPAALEYGTPTIPPQCFVRAAFLNKAKEVERTVTRRLEQLILAAAKRQSWRR